MKNNVPKTRVLHIIGRLVTGGVERRTLELIEHMDNSSIEHHVCLTSGGRGTLDAAYEQAGANLHYSNIKSPLFWLKLHLLLRQNSIDVVHSNIMYMSGPILFVAWLARVRKRIVHFQTDGVLRNGSALYMKRTELFKRLLDKVATHIVGLTPANLELSWKKNWQSDPRCILIPNGVEVADLNQKNPTELDEFVGKTVILHAGRANLPTKNREKAIKVFSAYEKFNPDAVLVFVGRDGNDSQHSAEQLKKWRSLANSYGVEGKVRFLGEKSDMKSYYLASDMLLFTSTKEGLPGVILEALAAGLPVVSSNVPGAVYISGKFENVIVLDPNLDDEIWASELAKFGESCSEPLRLENIDNFKGSGFTIEDSLKKYIQLWTF